MSLIRVYTDYDPIRIVSGNDLDKTAKKAGLIGNSITIDQSELPQSREHRNEWEIKNGKVAVDQEKVAAKLTKITEKATKKKAVLDKLKITNEEMKDLLSGL